IISSPTSCDISNAAIDDSAYQAGDAYSDSGSGWQPLATTAGRFDLPFRTLIQPAMDVGYLNRSRGGDAAALLTHGKVLLAGPDNTADVYDPVTNSSALTGSMGQFRTNHTATRLLDGTVLVAGGRDGTGTRSATAEIFDPATNAFTATAAPMSAARELHTATL